MRAAQVAESRIHTVAEGETLTRIARRTHRYATVLADSFVQEHPEAAEQHRGGGSVEDLLLGCGKLVLHLLPRHVLAPWRIAFAERTSSNPDVKARYAQ